jgi:hypothetical protein
VHEISYVILNATYFYSGHIISIWTYRSSTGYYETLLRALR